LILTQKKIISDKHFFMEKIMIKRIELREYQLESNDIDDCDDDGCNVYCIRFRRVW